MIIMRKRTILFLISFAFLAIVPDCWGIVPDGYYVDGFDYPVSHRGYNDDNNHITIAENINLEQNSLYPSNPVARPNRQGLLIEDGWFNLSDVGNYVNDGRTNGIHPGEDWNYGFAGDDIGKKIHVIANGKITRIAETWHNDLNGAGYKIIIKHYLPDNTPENDNDNRVIYSYYLHIAPTCNCNDDNICQENLNGQLSGLDQFGLRVDDWVRRGDVIGVIGNISPMGDHLHFEMRDGGLIRNENNIDNNGEELDNIGTIWRNDNTLGYYTDIVDVERPNNDMTLEQVMASFTLMQDDGVIDPSDFIDEERPLVKEVIVNGGLEIYGGSLSDNPEIFVRFKVVGGQFPNINVENFRISKINHDNEEEFRTENLVTNTFRPYDDNEYSFRVLVPQNVINENNLTNRMRYNIAFDVVSGTERVRVVARDKLYFFSADGFADLTTNDDEWYFWYVNRSLDNALIHPYLFNEYISLGETEELDNPLRYDANASLTRKEMAKLTVLAVYRLVMVSQEDNDIDNFIFEINTGPTPNCDSNPNISCYFDDVDTCHPYFPYIQMLKNNGIIEGNRDGQGQLTNNFDPDRDVNRAELSKFLEVTFSIPDPLNHTNFENLLDHTDIEAQQLWAVDYIRNLVDQNVDRHDIENNPNHNCEPLLRGYSDGNFKPGNSVNRAEMSKFILNIFDAKRFGVVNDCGE